MLFIVANISMLNLCTIPVLKKSFSLCSQSLSCVEKKQKTSQLYFVAVFGHLETFRVPSAALMEPPRCPIKFRVI